MHFFSSLLIQTSLEKQNLQKMSFKRIREITFGKEKINHLNNSTCIVFKFIRRNILDLRSTCHLQKLSKIHLRSSVFLPRIKLQVSSSSDLDMPTA